MKKRGRKASTSSVRRKKGVKSRKSASKSPSRRKRTRKSSASKKQKPKKSVKKKIKKKTTKKKSRKRKSVKKETWKFKRKRVVKSHISKEIEKVEHAIIPKAEKHTIPKGIRVLIGYFSVIALLYLIFLVLGFASPVALVFSNLIKGTWALIINIVVFIVLCYIIYGFLKRAKAAFYLSLLWLCVGIINSIISLMFMERTSIIALNNLIVLTSYAVLLINGLVIWYMLHEHHYFFDIHYHRKEFLKQDKIFIMVIAIVWIVVLVSALLVGMSFYDHTKQLTDLTIKELSQKYSWQVKSHCESKQGDARDMCFMIHAAIKKKNGESGYERACSHIKSEVYRFTCLRLVQEW